MCSLCGIYKTLTLFMCGKFVRRDWRKHRHDNRCLQTHTASRHLVLRLRSRTKRLALRGGQDVSQAPGCGQVPRRVRRIQLTGCT